MLNLEINISVYLSLTDVKYFGFTEECIDVNVILQFYVIMVHTKITEAMARYLEFPKK